MFSELLWRVESQRPELFLTFDDGPIPEVSPWVLDQLDQFDAKASFFCVGQNIERFPEIFDLIKAKGHTIGNHTYNHLSGWCTDNAAYFENVRKGALVSGSNLFRPPYGRLKPSQTRFLKRHYQIVMWDVLSGDFDPNLSADACFTNVVKNTQPGSIIVFHDSLKSAKRLYEVLPRILEYYSLQGYQFKALDSHSVLSYADKEHYSFA
ncbi:MAG TPA: polysaccharide deacetylase family protein [Saprospiraceae bacterium]|nr:polysaccharide deacetylase family protein [Saprospiraceae bacterium]